MTTLRPERSADGSTSYEDTGQFEAAVGQLNDPLNDPLPGRPAAVPDPRPAGPARPGGRHGAVPPGYGQTRPVAPPQGVLPRHRGPAEAADPFAVPVVPVAPSVQAGGYPAPPGNPYGPSAEQAPEGGDGLVSWFQQQSQASPQDRFRQQSQDRFLDRPQDPPQRSDHRGGPAGSTGEAADQTAKLPVVGAVPGHGAGEDTAVLAAVSTEATSAGAAGVPGTAPGEPGGRAARRKAAARNGGHRARGRTPAQPPAAPPDAAVPMTRMEARRAAKAAKESPAVVASRVIGEVFITAGVLMLLFVSYQLWWTNVRAHEQADSASNKLEQQWKTEQSDPDRAPGTFSPGQGFAIMYIPKLDVKAPIAQGVDKTKVLDHGMVGHYDGALNTAMPWDKSGNFAVAAHRNTHGEPFRYINHLVPGDKVVVETSTTYYTYQITSSLASTPPTNISVLQPVPVGSGFTQPGRYITLTTCTPEFTSTNRLIVWGKLVEERPRSEGKPDALVDN
ncbi:class E sortase [Actinacidiphila yeochonensis]|uniref:class E sortase n=1 Tax=Actinacidiphila yeochonensis TaxID=89050 RepID=UPI00055F367D|nr:class E sortase [Actinacidiphila yeochonensis]